MNSFAIKESVQNLLDSDISSSVISNVTQVNISTLSKLRSKSQEIDDTNFASIRKLYDFYLVNEKVIEAQKGVPNYILSQKIPSRVERFIDELASGVELIHEQEVSRINKVYVYDEYTIDEFGNSNEKSSYIEIKETIPISKNGDVYPYHIAIKNEIKSRKYIESIKGLKIVFNREKLEITLKKYKSKGGKIKTYKTDEGGISIKVTSPVDNTEIYGIESEYFEIQYQEIENKQDLKDLYVGSEFNSNQGSDL